MEVVQTMDKRELQYQVPPYREPCPELNQLLQVVLEPVAVAHHLEMGETSIHQVGEVLWRRGDCFEVVARVLKAPAFLSA